jgi:hypothetical protein
LNNEAKGNAGKIKPASMTHPSKYSGKNDSRTNFIQKFNQFKKQKRPGYHPGLFLLSNLLNLL